MSIEIAREHLKKYHMEERIQEFDVSSATVELAAAALGVEPARIAKSLSFKQEDHAILVVAAGDAKVDNRKFKDTFGLKAKMLTPEEVLELTGHSIGGVCPFGNPENVRVYLDESLKRFQTVFPAAGSSNSAVEMTMEELWQTSEALEWVNVCKNWEA